MGEALHEVAGFAYAIFLQIMLMQYFCKSSIDEIFANWRCVLGRRPNRGRTHRQYGKSSTLGEDS
jgi:hypothetical protein